MVRLSKTQLQLYEKVWGLKCDKAVSYSKRLGRRRLPTRYF